MADFYQNVACSAEHQPNQRTSVVGDNADASQFASANQLSRNHEPTRTSVLLPSMAASIQA